MTYRALELLNLPSNEPAFLLDIGCGSGLSGEILDEEGHIWAGLDIAPSMLGERFVYPLQYLLDAMAQRSRWKGRSRAISSCKISARVSVSDQEVLTVQLGINLGDSIPGYYLFHTVYLSFNGC
jgi:hypothetical protein